MLAEHNGDPEVGVELLERGEQLLSAVRVELAGGLIQHEGARLGGEGGGDGHALALAAAERGDAAAA